MGLDWLTGLKYIFMFIVGICILYIIIRLSSAAIFRSYFEAKWHQLHSKKEKRNEKS